jgi:hypothetical protein
LQQAALVQYLGDGAPLPGLAVDIPLIGFRGCDVLLKIERFRPTQIPVLMEIGVTA